MTVDQMLKRLSKLSKQGHGRRAVRIYAWDGDYTTFKEASVLAVRVALSDTERHTLWQSEGDLLTLPFVALS